MGITLSLKYRAVSVRFNTVEYTVQLRSKYCAYLICLDKVFYTDRESTEPYNGTILVGLGKV